MSILIIPHSGKYYGQFEFAVVKSGRESSKLRVTVLEAEHKHPVYTTKDTWPSGNKLSLPPGNYTVYAELCIPRLDGSHLSLDRVEAHYTVAQRNVAASDLPDQFNGELMREEMAANSSRVDHLSPIPTTPTPPSFDDGKSQSSDTSKDAAGDASRTPHFFQGPPNAQRGTLPWIWNLSPTSVQNGAAESAPIRAAHDGSRHLSQNVPPAYAFRGYSEHRSHSAARVQPYTNGGSRHPSQSATPLHTLHDYSEQQTRHTTPLHTLHDSSEQQTRHTTPLHTLHGYSEQQTRHTTPLHTLHDYSEQQTRHTTPLHTLHGYSEQQTRHATPAQFSANGVSHRESQNDTPVYTLHDYSEQHSRSSTPARALKGVPSPASRNSTPASISHWQEEDAIGIRLFMSKNARPDPFNNCGLQENAESNAASPDLPLRSESRGHGPVLSIRDPSPAEALKAFSEKSSRDVTPAVAAKKQTILTEQRQQEERIGEQNGRASGDSRFLSVPRTPSVASTMEKRDSPLFVSRSEEGNASRSPNRGNTQLTNANTTSPTSGPIFIVSPPDVINVREPFSFALAFGATTAAPTSSMVFINVLLEEDEPAAKTAPAEPIICVLSATLAAVPIVARGLTSLWVCSPSISTDARRGVMRLLGGGGLGEARNGMAISAVCVGPSCSGLALSGIQFVLDGVLCTKLCQFFVAFREISVDDDDDDEEEEGAHNDGEYNSHPEYQNENASHVEDPSRVTRNGADESTRYSSTLDDRALSAEVIYNALPYIRCAADAESAEMVLEVHRKSSIMARVPLPVGSRVAMYFGTSTSRGNATEKAKQPTQQQPYISVLVNYRTVFSQTVRADKLPQMLRPIVMSGVECDKEKAYVSLSEVEFLSQQRRPVAFADDVTLNEEKAMQLGNGKPQGPRGANMTAWIAGHKPEMSARQHITLV